MQHLISSSGYLAILILMVAESACIPFPSEITMLFGGYLAATGHLNLVGVIVLGTLGNLIGSYIAWAVGRTGGRVAVAKWGRYVGLRTHDVDRAEVWFDRHGESAVFFGRLLPVVRTFISLPAGVAEMKPGRFGAFTLLGCIPWTAALGIAGYELGGDWHKIVKYFSDVTYLIVVVVIVVVAIAGYLRFKNKLRPSSEVSSSPSDV
ncbi:MAG: DedA family protein [Acidimicrobiales bacterium]